MKIIFAQGNPGHQLKNTRHNVGFIAIDYLAEKWGLTFTEKPKFNAEVAEVTREGEKILLVKPLSYYNETGHVARQLLDFYKLNAASDFLVIHDELALPLGVIRTRQSGSDAGNNGIKSLNSHIGPAYARLRIGIYTEKRDHIDDADFVLGHFSLDEKETIATLLPHIVTFVTDFIAGSLPITKIRP